MSRFISRITNIFEAVPGWVRRRRLVLWPLFLVLTAIAAAGIGRVDMDSSVSSFFSADEPVRQAYDRFRAVFGSDEVLYIVYEARDGDVFSRQSLEAVKLIQDRLWGPGAAVRSGSGSPLDHITDVVTIVNVSYLEAGDGSSLISRDLVGEDLPESELDSERLRELALAHPDYPRLLVSPDGRYGGIIIRTDFNSEVLDDQSWLTDQETEDLARWRGRTAGAGRDGDPSRGEDAQTDLAELGFEMGPDVADDILVPRFKTTMMEEYVPFIEAVREITDDEQIGSALELYYAGNPELMGFIANVVMKEMGLIMLGSLVLIMIVLALLFRSLSAVVWPVLIVICTIIWMLGSIGWSSTPTGDTINILIFLMIAVGIADAVHILSGYLLFRREGRDHCSSLSAVFVKSGPACLLASLTTAAGMLSMAAVPIISMQRFGVFAALGVLYALVLSIVMLPLMLDIKSPAPRAGREPEGSSGWRRRSRIQALLAWVAGFGERSPRAVAITFVAIGLVLLGGFWLIRVDSSTLTIFRESLPLRQAFEKVDQTMAGTGNLEIVIDAGVADGHKDPEVLRAIDELQLELETELPEIVHTTISLANVTKDSFKVLNEDRPEMYRIPEDPLVLAQTLVLFDGANPEDRRLLVSDDYRVSRIMTTTRNLSSEETVTFMADVSERAERHFAELAQRYPRLEVSLTGQIPLFLKMMDDMSWSQVKSFAVTLAIISAILLFVLGSVRLGLVSIIPNLFPIVTVFGVMGYLGIPLDLHTLLVLPIIIGISVDDTIHFLTHFRIERSRGSDVETAIRHATSEAGQAIIFTSLILAVGYLIFLISVNKGFGYFGTLSSIAVSAACIADLVLLPALLRWSFRD